MEGRRGGEAQGVADPKKKKKMNTTYFVFFDILKFGNLFFAPPPRPTIGLEGQTEASTRGT
jgi:hypothetical protein